MRVVTLALSGLLSCCVFSANSSEIVLPKQQLKPFTLNAQGVQLTDQLAVYQYQQKLLLPLQGLATSLGIDVQVDPHALIASGWIQGENANLMLDLNKDQARRGFNQIAVDPAMIWGRDNVDIYLEPQFIQKLLPINLNIHTLGQKVNVSASVPLPAVQQSVTLNQVTNDPEDRREITATSFDPIHPHDYQPYNKPVVYLQGDAAIAGEDYLTEDYHLNMLATGDLGYHSYEFSYDRSQGQDDNYRLRLSRDYGDLDERLPFQLGGYQVGDVSYYGDNLVNGRIEGQGVVFGNQSDINSDRFGRTVIEGNAPAGWKVHLYRNGALVRIASASDDNRYRFRDIPVVEGSNLFEIHLFGPNGEYMVRRKTVQSGGLRLGQGQLGYSGFYIDQTSNLFTHKDQDELADLELRRAYSGRAQYGLTDQITIGASYSQQTVQNWGRLEDRTYYGADVTAYWWDSTWFVEVSSQQDAGNAFSLGWQKLIGTDHSLRITHENYQDYQSSRTDDLLPGLFDDNGKTSSTRAEIEGSFHQAGGWQYQLGAAYRTLDNGDDSTQLDSRLSTQLGNVALTNYLAYDTSFKDSSQRMLGRLMFDTPMLDWNVSGYMDYQTGEGIGDLTTLLRWRPWRGVNNQTELFYRDPLDSKSRFGLGHQVSLTYDWFTLGLRGNVDTRGDWQVSATSAIALNYQDSRMRGSDYRPQLADINVRLFVDSNNNGRFDASDQPIRGVTLLTSPSIPHQASNDTGEVRLTQVASNTLYRIALGPETLPEQMVLRDGPVEVMPMTGKHVTVDLPLVALTDIKGQVVKDHDGQPLAGVHMVLKDLHQQPLANLTTGPQGEFQFNAMKPGYYLLQPDVGQLGSLGALAEEPVFPVAISGKKIRFQQQDLRIKYQEQPAVVDVTSQVAAPQATPTRKLDSLPALEQGVMRMESQDYTIQLAANRNKFDLNALRARHPDQSLEQVTVLRDGRPMHLLIAGQFPSQRSAQYGLRDVPKEFANDLPLVKPVGGLQYQHRAYLEWDKKRKPQPDRGDDRNSDWLSQQNPAHFTWQLAATKDKANAEKVIAHLKLGTDAHIHLHKGWYQVLWGSFADKPQAQRALGALPKAPQNPWLRSVASVR